MRFGDLIGCILILLVSGSALVAGEPPTDDSLTSLYSEYVTYSEARRSVTHMGLPIGASAPVLSGVDFSTHGTVIVFLAGDKFSNLTPQSVALFKLLNEWGGRTDLQIVAVLGSTIDTRMASALLKEAPLTNVIRDQSASFRFAYHIELLENPSHVFFFVDRSGRVAYRWFGFPIFGEPTHDFMSVPEVLSQAESLPSDLILLNHPDSTLGNSARFFDFITLEGQIFSIADMAEPTLFYFIRSVPDIASTEASLVVKRLAESFSSHLRFVACIPDVTAEGLLMSKEMVELGLREFAVAPESENLHGPLPSSLEDIADWLDEVFAEDILPAMTEAQEELGIPIIRDMGSQALFTWGISTYGYGTYIILDTDGTILAFEKIEPVFEPLYIYWIEEVIN